MSWYHTKENIVWFASFAIHSSLIRARLSNNLQAIWKAAHTKWFQHSNTMIALWQKYDTTRECHENTMLRAVLILTALALNHLPGTSWSSRRAACQPIDSEALIWLSCALQVTQSGSSYLPVTFLESPVATKQLYTIGSVSSTHAAPAENSHRLNLTMMLTEI